MKLTKVNTLCNESDHVMELYQTSKPIAYGYAEPEGETNYVVISAVNNGFANETYIFPASADGSVLNWMELDGSHQQGMNIPLAVSQFEERN